MEISKHKEVQSLDIEKRATEELAELKEKLEKDRSMQRLCESLALAESGVFMLYSLSPNEAQLCLEIIKEKVSTLRNEEIRLEIYIVITDDNYNSFHEEERSIKIFNPLRDWIEKIQKKEYKNNPLFVIDGSGIDEENRTLLIDHFAIMNGQRNKLAGNSHGPVLIIIPSGLNIESDIAKYSDLMSCISMRARPITETQNK